MKAGWKRNELDILLATNDFILQTESCVQRDDEQKQIGDKRCLNGTNTLEAKVDGLL